MNCEWAKYKIGDPENTANFSNYSCEQLSSVYHIAHLDDAIRIFQDGYVNDQIVQDKSRLKNRDIYVSWVSPNQWKGGKESKYGNICFIFNWNPIAQNKQFYWVESEVHKDTYRMLISDNDRSLTHKLTKYDPCKLSGPLYSRDNCWYYNARYINEFMIEAPLSLETCSEIKFIDHHPEGCFKYYDKCQFLGTKGIDIGKLFISKLIGCRINNRSIVNKLFLKGDRQFINKVILGIKNDLINSKNIRFGKDNFPNKNAIIEDMLALYAKKRLNEALELIKYFVSKDNF